LPDGALLGVCTGKLPCYTSYSSQTMVTIRSLHRICVLAIVCAATLSFSAACWAGDVVIYKMTVSERFTFNESRPSGFAHLPNHRGSNRERAYVIYDRSADTFRLVYYGRERTYNGAPLERFRRTDSTDHPFTNAFETTYENGRDYLVLSMWGTGDGSNHSSDTGGSTIFDSTVETIEGRLKTQRLRTVLDGIVEIRVPSSMKGNGIFEKVDYLTDSTKRTQTIRKSGLRLDKGLTTAVHGMSLEDAVTSVESSLQSKGYTNLSSGS
jgi:hypothetical protein